MFSKALVSIFAALFFCTAIAAQQGVAWQKLESKEGKFSGLFPCKPEMSSEDVRNSGMAAKLVSYSCSYGEVWHVMAYSDFPAGSLAKTTLDTFRDGIVKGFQGKVISEKVVSLSSNPGREFAAKTDAPGTDAVSIWRIYLVGVRMYAVGVSKKSSHASSNDEAKFFSSLALQK